MAPGRPKQGLSATGVHPLRVGPSGGGAGGSTSVDSVAMSAALRALAAPEVETGAKAETEGAATAKIRQLENFILIVLFLMKITFKVVICNIVNTVCGHNPLGSHHVYYLASEPLSRIRTLLRYRLRCRLRGCCTQRHV